MEIAFWTVCLFPPCAGLLSHVWDYCVRPRLIPRAEIEAAVDALIARHGRRADEVAFIEEDRAWRRSETFACGKWRRVRRALWRRVEFDGPQDGEG